MTRTRAPFAGANDPLLLPNLKFLHTDEYDDADDHNNNNMEAAVTTIPRLK